MTTPSPKRKRGDKLEVWPMGPQPEATEEKKPAKKAASKKKETH